MINTSRTLKRAALAGIRYYSVPVSGATGKPFPPLPPITEWRKAFPGGYHQGNQHRSQLFNQDTASKWVNRMGLGDGSPKTVFEMYPGPGVLTRELLKLPRSALKNLYVMDHGSVFADNLDQIAEVDDRLKVFKFDPYYWTTWEDIQADGYLDGIESLNYDQGIHPELRIIGNLPNNVQMEQWMSQILRLVAERGWLWSYGRIPVHLMMQEKVWKRLIATDDRFRQQRCKLSVIAEATCNIEETMTRDELDPHTSHFINYTNNVPFIGVNLTPLAEPYIKSTLCEEWDYILRSLYVRKSQRFEESIDFLTPGARNLLPKLTDSSLPLDQQVDIKRTVRSLHAADWANIVRVFDEWPFKPSAIMMRAVTKIEIERSEVKKKV